MPKRCNNCHSKNIETRMFDVDGQNLVEDFICLDCNNYYRGQPPIIKYEHLTKQQIDFLTQNYDNQETAEEVQQLLIQAQEVGLNITTDLVSFEDCTADLAVKRECGQIKYFSELCHSPYWVCHHIQAFGEDVDIALDILDKVLAWIEEGEKEGLIAQVLKANFLIDVLLNEGSNYYLDDGLILLKGKELEQIPKIYNQMMKEIINPKIQKIIYTSYDQKYKDERQLLNLIS